MHKIVMLKILVHKIFEFEIDAVLVRVQKCYSRSITYYVCERWTQRSCKGLVAFQATMFIVCSIFIVFDVNENFSTTKYKDLVAFQAAMLIVHLIFIVFDVNKNLTRTKISQIKVPSGLYCGRKWLTGQEINNQLNMTQYHYCSLKTFLYNNM